MTAEMNEKIKSQQQEMSSIYYETDSYEWTEQINNGKILQHSTKPPGMDVMMFKCKTILNCAMLNIRQIFMNVEIRRQWETILYDIESFDVTKDMNYQIQYYAYKSPPMASDRDFLAEVFLWHDFPEPGMMSISLQSVEDPRMPVQKNKVRAHVYNQLLVVKPLEPVDGKERCEVLLVNNIDINGLVPKWIVNLAARTAPA